MTQRVDAPRADEITCSSNSIASDTVAGHVLFIFGILQMGILAVVVVVCWGDSEVLSPFSLLAKLLVYTAAVVWGILLIRRDVSVDSKGVTLGRALGPSTRINWGDVRRVRVAPRTLYDEVMDVPADATFELLLSRGGRAVLPLRRLPRTLVPTAFQMLIDGVPQDAFVADASLERQATDGRLPNRSMEANTPSLVTVVACLLLFHFLQFAAAAWLLDTCVFPFCWIPGFLYAFPIAVLCLMLVHPILSDISSGKANRLREMISARLRSRTLSTT